VLNESQIYFCFAIDTINVESVSRKTKILKSKKKLIPVENRSLKSENPTKSRKAKKPKNLILRNQTSPIENFYLKSKVLRNRPFLNRRPRSLKKSKIQNPPANLRSLAGGTVVFPSNSILLSFCFLLFTRLESLFCMNKEKYSLLHGNDKPFCKTNVSVT